MKDNAELEETKIVLIRDKKVMETLLHKIIKSFHNRDMSILVTDIVNLNFTLIQLESEKVRYEMQIKEVDRQKKSVDNQENPFSANYELNQTLLNEKNNLKELLIKQENKIGI